MIKAFRLNKKGEASSSVVCCHDESFARSVYYTDRQDWEPDLKLSDIESREIPLDPFPEDFARIANYRGVSKARIGQRVLVSGKEGWIVGKNESANFNVLFLKGYSQPIILGCHPGFEMEYCED